jgi:hypothetical protein
MRRDSGRCGTGQISGMGKAPFVVFGKSGIEVDEKTKRRKTRIICGDEVRKCR